MCYMHTIMRMDQSYSLSIIIQFTLVMQCKVVCQILYNQKKTALGLIFAQGITMMRIVRHTDYYLPKSRGPTDPSWGGVAIYTIQETDIIWDWKQYKVGVNVKRWLGSLPSPELVGNYWYSPFISHSAHRCWSYFNWANVMQNKGKSYFTPALAHDL